MIYTFPNGIPSSSFEKKDGNYILTFQGQEVKISFSDFPEHWQNTLLSYNNAWSYVNSEKDKRVKKITGKTMYNLTKIEHIMFLKHSQAFNFSSFLNI